MLLQEKLGLLYGMSHCSERPCDNCSARNYCCEAARREALWEEILNEVAALTKEIDKAKEETK